MHTPISKGLSCIIVLNQMRERSASPRPYALLCAVVCALGMFVCSAAALAQQAPDDQKLIASIRDRIQVAQHNHASDEELGHLWLALGNRYQDQLIGPEAEDAFARALRLLTGKNQARGDYADALAGMGSLYLADGRYRNAADFLQRSAQVYESLGDAAHAASLHESLAITLTHLGKYRESEAQSLLARSSLESLHSPDPAELLASRITHAYALCYQDRCSPALAEVDEAVVNRQIRPDSLEMVAALLARAFIQSRLGADWEPDVTRALHITRSQTGVSTAVRSNIELSVLRQYGQLLKASQRNPDTKAREKEIAQQIARLEEQRPSPCTGCTVNVSAFAPTTLLH